jgi:hypothetical protein
MSGETGLAGVRQNANAVYTLGSPEGESVRLLRQADELTAYSPMVLDRADVRPGHSAVDLGCGPRGSPGGRVVGVETDQAHVAIAAGFAAKRGTKRPGAAPPEPIRIASGSSRAAFRYGSHGAPDRPHATATAFAASPAASSDRAATGYGLSRARST